MLSSISRSAVRLASHNNLEMLSKAAHSLPFAAQRAAAAPLPALSVLSRSFATVLTRAQKESNPVQCPGSSPRASSSLEARLLDMRTIMPPPFSRMADHMLQMQREMDSLMGAFGMPSSLMTDPWDIFDRAAAPLAARRGVGLGRMIPLDVSEDDKCYKVTAEVPGFDKSEIKVSLSEDGLLTMTGAHEEGSLAGAEVGKEGEAATKAEGEAAKEGGPPSRVPIRPRSRRHSFTQSIQLPEGVDLAAVTATTHHGVLTVRIPKVPEQAPKVRMVPVA
ncbi:hypothetical protein Vretimale_7958 [Volvox reticuliferus]|uniref:SHSP domain-containing protein n=1 Tax=Volvox reticuliferus TaxID=1737510 RepID=A0A8J4FHK5_9CHLO|nr:hypothetical protein Vretifemale_5184 [Volvox reticuliferus]GIM03268.1 hypothetical protein Vretimale_7958 [Volvox reticuliferus]